MNEQEPVILILKEAMRNDIGLEAIDGNPPEYDSEAHGEIVRAIKVAQDGMLIAGSIAETSTLQRFYQQYGCCR